MPNHQKKKQILEAWTALKAKIIILKEQGFSQVSGNWTLQKLPVSQKEYLTKRSWTELEQEKNRLTKFFNLRNQEVIEKNHQLKLVRDLVNKGDLASLKTLVKEI